MATPDLPSYFPRNFELEAGYADQATHIDSAPHLYLVPGTMEMKSWRYRGVKRVIDLTFSTLMLIPCLIPGLIIAAAIVASSKGPIFYSEIRVGRNRRPFRIWKFRSMSVPKAPLNNFETARHLEILSRWRTKKDTFDPRITTIGRFIRRWSLDELPQLINVLKGDMSLVGPRPVVRAELPLYKHLRDFYLATTPGLSGLWQVSGRSNLSFTARAKLDATYVQSWSLRQDFLILALTIPAVLKRVGAR